MTTDYRRLARKLSFKAGESSLLISNLCLPHARDLDPLGKIWAILRRRFSEEYGVNVAGVFGYDDAQELISCNFFLDFANITAAQNQDGIYEKTYRKNFDAMMTRFEDVIIQFIVEPSGLAAYEELFTSSILSRIAFDAIFNKFLKEIGVRTDEDDQRAAYHRDLLNAVAIANRMAAASPPIPRRLLRA